MKVLVTDMGGTFIKYGICEVSKTGVIKFLSKGRFKTPESKQSNRSALVVETIAKFARDTIKKDKSIKCVCSTVGGIVDVDNYLLHFQTVHNGHYLNLNIRKIFNKYCKLPFHIINDVKAGALGELRYGALKNKKDAVFMAIGTGIAASFICNGKIHVGYTFGGGEIGQAVVNGHYFEQHCGVGALIKRCQEVDNSIVTAEDCLERMHKNVQIKNIIDSWFVQLVDGVNTLCYVLNTKYFVFGGKITEHKYFDLKVFHDLMVKNCRQPALPNIRDVVLLKASLGNDAALYGAASLVWNKNYAL